MNRVTFQMIVSLYQVLGKQSGYYARFKKRESSDETIFVAFADNPMLDKKNLLLDTF